MPVSSGHRCILSNQFSPETFSDFTRFCGLRNMAQKTDSPCPYQNLLTRSHTQGLVAVSSGRVTVEDMKRADEAATNDLLPPKSHALYRRRLYFELKDGSRLQDPEGVKTTILLSAWLFLDVDREQLATLK